MIMTKAKVHSIGAPESHQKIAYVQLTGFQKFLLQACKNNAHRNILFFNLDMQYFSWKNDEESDSCILFD